MAGSVWRGSRCSCFGVMDPRQKLAFRPNRAKMVGWDGGALCHGAIGRGFANVRNAEVAMADPLTDELYERDFYTWTQEQAARLRALAGHNAIDAEHVAEEIADLGQERRDATQSNLERCLEHLVKLAASPATAPEGTWTSEARTFAKHARRKFSPGMRRHLDLDAAWADAVASARDQLSDYGETPDIAAVGPCPFTLDELLDPAFDVDAAVLRVQSRVSPGDRDK